MYCITATKEGQFTKSVPILKMIISLPTGVVSKECTAICVTFKN